jgi:hypothetical protein
MSIQDTYSLSGKLDVFTQLSLARKLAPALPIVDVQLQKENKGKPKAILVVMMLAQISDEDSAFVVRKCLSIVMRKQDTGLAKVQADNGSIMFDDIPMEEILEMVSWVIEENLGDFLRTALTDSAV